MEWALMRKEKCFTGGKTEKALAPLRTVQIATSAADTIISTRRDALNVNRYEITRHRPSVLHRGNGRTHYQLYCLLMGELECVCPQDLKDIDAHQANCKQLLARLNENEQKGNRNT